MKARINPSEKNPDLDEVESNYQRQLDKILYEQGILITEKDIHEQGESTQITNNPQKAKFYSPINGIDYFFQSL